jgi:hypothetical protein
MSDGDTRIGGGDVLHVWNLLARIGNRSETRFK